MYFIGISCQSSSEHYYLAKAYVKALALHGVRPLLISHFDDEVFINHIAGQLKGLVLAGGWDIDPEFYGGGYGGRRYDPVRDKFEILLAKKMFQMKKPVLGICRGMQLINVAFGGSLYNDVSEITRRNHWQRIPVDKPSHSVFIKRNTKLFRILKTEEVEVNSFHHQAIKEVANDFMVSAVSEDGVIEAIEHKEHPYFIGVQFHPEYMSEREPFIELFSSFVEQCND